MPFSNLGNLLGDINFWGGVAEGAGTEMLRQEDRKDKDIRELRKFGMERGLQISEENTQLLNEAEAQVRELAAMVAGNRSANSPEAMEAALYLIQNEGGIAGAAKLAGQLQEEFSTYGTDPVLKLGLTERTGGDVPTARDIGRTFTRLKPLPNLGASGIDVQQTAMDVIFGADSPEETVQSEMESMFGAEDMPEAFTAVSSEGFDKELILGTNFKNELKRMNVLLNRHNRVPVEQRDAAWTNTENTIKTNIDMLKEAEKLSRLETQTMSDSTRTTLEGKYLSTLLSSSGLKGEWQLGQYIPQGVQADIMQTAEDAIATMGSLVQLARNNGYVGRVDGDEKVYDPLEFVKKFGAARGNRIILVTPEDGEPYLTIGGLIFDDKLKSTQSWKQSIVQGGTTPSVQNNPPAVGNNPPQTGGATPGSNTTIPDSLLTDVKSTVASQRRAAATAIMTRIKNANPNANQTQLEDEFKNITGIDYATASK